MSSRLPRFLFPLIAIAVSLPRLVSAQSDVGELQLGKSIERELKAGETRDELFVIHVDPPDERDDEGEALLGLEQHEYYLVARADVENTPLAPADRMRITVVDA